MNSITIQLHDGSRKSFIDREAWTLCHLINAHWIGITKIDHPAPRWSRCVYKLRQAGLAISAEYEPHTRLFPVMHGRYRLETPVTVVAEREAA